MIVINIPLTSKFVNYFEAVVDLLQQCWRPLSVDGASFLYAQATDCPRGGQIFAATSDTTSSLASSGPESKYSKYNVCKIN